MNTERQRRIRAAFEAASSLPPGDQTDFVRRNAGDDVELAESVLRLLRASRDGNKFLAKPLFPAEAPNALRGMRIGAYRVVREIGAGGMGVVYLATRADDAFRRVSALKVIRAGLNTPKMIDRFLRERQILAELDHPNIARIVDGGTTPDGLPYFVMDYVDGRPIDAFANERQAEVDQRLNLFRQACQAVQYLHDNRIIHRDLKPANMLVTSGGTVKLLDFGIAKLLDAESGTKNTVPLATGAYASPEQLAEKPTGPASDIYSLGAILYELLTGELPRETSGTSAKPVTSTKDIRKPSTRNRTNPLLKTKESPTDLRRKLQGDLDSILMKALREEPGLRYASASAFAADIENYQSQRPVAARNGAALYVVSRFTRRNRLGVAAVLLLSASLSWGGWEQWRINQLVAQMNRPLTDERAQIDRLQAARLVNSIPGPSPHPGPASNSSSNHTPAAAPAPTSDTAAADQHLSETIKQVANNYQDTFPRLVDNPLTSRKQKEEILNRDLSWLQQITPLAGQKPELSTDLSRAYLQIAMAQWSSDRPSLDDPSGSLETCRKALEVIRNLPETTAQSEALTTIESGLSQQMSKLQAGHS